VVASGVDIGIAEDEQRAYRWALDKAYGGLENCDTGALTADQGARHMETVFRQQLWQIVARDAAGNIGIALPYDVGIFIP
jgi:hypothetical protein